jgi:putative transcription antitermination factor YqgF
MNYLGLDYGQKHLGIALAAGPLAEPLATISTTKALRILPRLIDSHQIKTIIIGLPEGRVQSDLRLFIHNLKILGCPVISFPETLSTWDAIQSLFHKTKNKRKLKEHAAAAAIILQSWLDSRSTPV